METIYIAKKNKEIKEQQEAITKENDVLKRELRSMDGELTQAKAKAKELNIRKMTSTNARRFSQVNQHATFSNEPFLQIRTTWIQPS